MRKLFTGILLAAALPAFASITSDVNEGIKSADAIVSEAIAACDGGAACQELAIEEALAAGLDVDTVLSAAIASGTDATLASNAAVNAGQSPADVNNAVTTALANLTTENATAGGTQGGFNAAPAPSNTPSAPALTTTTGISQAN